MIYFFLQAITKYRVKAVPAAAVSTAETAFYDSGSMTPASVTQKFDLVRKNTPTIVPVANGYAGGDCYKDSLTARILEQIGYTSDDMTVESCTGWCMDMGMKYAGVEYAQEYVLDPSLCIFVSLLILASSVDTCKDVIVDPSFYPPPSCLRATTPTVEWLARVTRARCAEVAST